MNPRARWRYLRYRRRQRRYLATLPEGAAEPLEYTDAESGVLLIAFGGLNRAIGIPPFEFMRLTEDMPIKRLFVRDPRQAWYHRGLPGHGDTLMDCLEVLRPHVEAASRTVVTGSSAGGYAALLFGSMLGVDEIVAFGPQTMLRLEDLHSFGDRRWDEHLEPLARAGVMDRNWLDLAKLPSLPHAHVYYDEELAVDRIHAERVAGIAVLHACSGGGHDLVRELRDSGRLAEILRSALAPADGGSAGAPLPRGSESTPA